MSQSCPFPFFPPLHSSILPPLLLPSSLFSPPVLLISSHIPSIFPSHSQPPLDPHPSLSPSPSFHPLLSVLLKSQPYSVHVLVTKWQTRDSFRLLKAKARCVQIYLALLSQPFYHSYNMWFFFFFFFFEPHQASLCLKLRVMALFTSREDHGEKKRSGCSQRVCSFFLYFSWNHWSAVCFPPLWRHRGGSHFQPLIHVVHIKTKASLISPYTFSTAEWSLLAFRGGHKYLWDKFVLCITVSIIKQMQVVWNRPF